MEMGRAVRGKWVGLGLERERGFFGEEREDEIRRSGDLEMVAATVVVVVVMERHLVKTIAGFKDLETC